MNAANSKSREYLCQTYRTLTLVVGSFHLSSREVNIAFCTKFTISLAQCEVHKPHLNYQVDEFTSGRAIG